MWRKIGCIVLVVVVIGIVAAVIYQQSKDGEGGLIKVSNSASKKSEEKESNFEAARTGDLSLVVEATGSTEPITDIDVMSEATGRITEFYVEEGDEVVEGDLICKLDQSNQLLIVEANEIRYKQAKLAYEEAKSATSPSSRSSYETALTAAQASFDNAEETFRNAELSFTRVEELHKKGYATDQELDSARQAMVSAKAAFDSAQANLADAKIKLDSFTASSDNTAIEQARLSRDAALVALNEARKQLGDSVIASPIPGIILEKPVDVGDSVVSINSAYGSGTPIVKVADLSRVQIRTYVDEIDIGKIKIGQTAKITVDSYFEQEFSGIVTNIFPQGETTGQGLVSFVVMVEVDNTDRLLLGNMTASVSIESDVKKDVLLIPLAATRAGEKPDTTIVHVLKEGEDPLDPKAKTEEREVVIGDTDYYDVVVLEGLEAGEQVKVRGFGTQIRFGG